MQPLLGDVPELGRTGVEVEEPAQMSGNFLPGVERECPYVEGVAFSDGFISVIIEQIMQPRLSRDWMGKMSRSLLLEC